MLVEVRAVALPVSQQQLDRPAPVLRSLQSSLHGSTRRVVFQNQPIQQPLYITPALVSMEYSAQAHYVALATCKTALDIVPQWFVQGQ